ncbi:MAG TPA: prolyl oligopeptidase family serine peptidase [Sedimentisphaerales bacterium]|nr:prolyl oligopeptidase family serine peptidase [Sedimentisphaerales bacterium]HRS12950.1 prolyl oligopeptidase family serine peptidase [Sedimentisphaerales bacterium]HRV49553.1 prolyl oligopeptidase family serine peptidase [Sedimentisphaerales bacterium]
MSHSISLTRKRSQSIHVIVLPFLLCSASPAAAQRPALEPLNRFPHMVQEYFVAQVRQIEQQSERRRTALSTRQEAETFVQDVQERIDRCFGPWPEKTPLNPRITAVVERDAYTVENVIFESRPDFLVTANLYIPKGRAFPLPGVVGTCGHSATGKAIREYQAFAQGLARQGYVVLLYDPLGQGERLQYPDTNLRSQIGVGVREHLHAGNQQFLVGEFLGSWRAWDGIRALDYLLTRKEVDPRRVGVTGNSGGGTMTTWLCGVERRWTMAAPACFVTTFRRNLENELPADTEQCPPRALAYGLDHEDFLAAMAPKPVIILAKEKDFFDVRGAESAYHSLRRLYRLFDAEENIGLFVGPSGHGYSQENREAMYRWFNAVTHISDATSEPNLTIEKDEALWCTPRGQVCELHSRPIYEFTKDKSEALAKQRPSTFSLSALQQRIRDVLHLPTSDPASAPEYRILRNWRSRGYPKPRWTVYLVETEPGIHAVVYRLGNEQLLSRPRATTKRAILYVAHLSSDAELRDEPLVAELIAADPNTDFYTVDVRGIGESRPDTCDENSYFDPYGSDYFYAIHSIMLDRPYIGQRTHDVLRVLDWLGQAGHDEVHMVGKGWGAIPATFAAVLSDRVTQVTLKNALTSYSDIAESKTYAWPLSTFVPNVLASFDLPDCYRALASKRLRRIEPWGPDAQPVEAVPSGN